MVTSLVIKDLVAKRSALEKQIADISRQIENQKKYQELSQTVSDMLERKQGLVREKEQAEQEIETLSSHRLSH